ncbi:hypothetical protein [Yersinia enterocolitica]|uniref:hypothetical protein n=1 Tax=Yersinia enterocolitica TaxID=630 RepID=UPI003D7A9997
MIRTQDLIIDKRNLEQLSKDEVKAILLTSQSARESIIDGFNAVGNLMFWACDNDRYPENEMRGDMANIGLLLTCNAGMLQGALEAEVIVDNYLANAVFPKK